MNAAPESADMSRAAFRGYVTHEILPFADSFDEAQKVPLAVIERMAAQGYLGAILPENVGGLGMNMELLGTLHEEVGRGCSSLRSLLTVHTMVSYAVLTRGSTTQKQFWLPKFAAGKTIAAFGLTEANAGSDPNRMETEAIRREACFVISGSKKWTTFGQIAEVFLVFAKCEGRISAFLIERDRPGVTVSNIHGMLGTRASMLANLTFDQCEIPKENLIGPIGFGMTMVGGAALDVGRYSVACGSVGIGQACLDASMDYADKREQFGSALKDHQLIARLLSQMVVNVKAARLLCQRAGELKDAGAPSTIFETLIAKYFATTMAMQAATDAVQIHGAIGCSSGSPVQRYFRDAKIMEIIEGSTQMQEIMIAQEAYSNRVEGL